MQVAGWTTMGIISRRVESIGECAPCGGIVDLIESCMHHFSRPWPTSGMVAVRGDSKCGNWAATVGFSAR